MNMVSCEKSEDQNNSHICVGCGQYVTDCKCIWGMHRELYQMFSDLSLKVDNHWELLYKADENLSKRFLKAEELLKFSDHDERIHDLENIQAESRLIGLEKCLKELNRFQDITHEQYKFNTKKKPHKCPLCDGKGKDTNRLVMDGVKEPSTINMKNPDCIACEGKGIVWG